MSLQSRPRLCNESTVNAVAVCLQQKDTLMVSRSVPNVYNVHGSLMSDVENEVEDAVEDVVKQVEIGVDDVAISPVEVDEWDVPATPGDSGSMLIAATRVSTENLRVVLMRVATVPDTEIAGGESIVSRSLTKRQRSVFDGIAGAGRQSFLLPPIGDVRSSVY